MGLTTVETEKIQKAVNWFTNILNKILGNLVSITHNIVDFILKSLRFLDPRVYTFMYHKKKRVSKKNRHRLLRKFYRLQAMVKT